MGANGRMSLPKQSLQMSVQATNMVPDVADVWPALHEYGTEKIV